MIIAGPCLYTNKTEEKEIYETAKQLNGYASHFRCKLWGGGTKPEKYLAGIGCNGLQLLEKIQNDFNFPCGTEVQGKMQIDNCSKLNYIWVGARNCHNYLLLSEIKDRKGDIFIKRGAGITVDETIGIYDIMKQIHNVDVYIIERGINTFDRQETSRWSPDLKGCIRIKHERPDIFDRLVVDCSHSVFIKDCVSDVHKAFKAIGVNHFMFECTASGVSRTDQGHMLSCDELKEIIK